MVSFACAAVRIPWGVILTVVLVGLGLVVLLVVGHRVMEQWRLIPTLFLPREVKVVHYAQVRRPVVVSGDRALLGVGTQTLCRGARSQRRQMRLVAACCCCAASRGQVDCEELDMVWLWSHLPAYAEFVDDLPVGE